MANPEVADQSVPDLSIHHPTLPAVVAEKLRQLIIDGTFKPGTWLNERDLCEQLKISRTPLREAYRMLASDGLVTLQPKRGAMVIELSADDVKNIFDVLSVLEGLAVRSAAEQATDAELAHIAQLHAQMRENYEKRDIRAYFAASMGTHIAINRAAHNPALTHAYDRLNLQVQALRYKSNFDSDEWTAAVADHEAFVQALMERDGERAEQLIRRHVGSKKTYNLRIRHAGASGA
ncbi:GntR family transcriptional regulator [Achromobacter denitrificans]